MARTPSRFSMSTQHQRLPTLWPRSWLLNRIGMSISMARWIALILPQLMGDRSPVSFVLGTSNTVAFSSTHSSPNDCRPTIFQFSIKRIPIPLKLSSHKPQCAGTQLHHSPSANPTTAVHEHRIAFPFGSIARVTTANGTINSRLGVAWCPAVWTVSRRC